MHRQPTRRLHELRALLLFTRREEGSPERTPRSPWTKGVAQRGKQRARRPLELSRRQPYVLGERRSR
eukprot:8508073-Alexandrium_andersonii.AAC.1